MGMPEGDFIHFACQKTNLVLWSRQNRAYARGPKMTDWKILKGVRFEGKTVLFRDFRQPIRNGNAMIQSD
ncbi:MAG: hypothetical protein U0176_03245 [Bacteroidia bacterium]